MEKIYKTMRNTGAASIAVGIIVASVGLAAGIIAIVNGALLLKMMQREMRLKWRHLLSCFSPVRSGSARNAKRMRESTRPGTGENKNGEV